MKKFGLLLVLSLVLLSAEPPKDTVATVGTENYITAADVQTRIDTMPMQYNQYYSSPDGRRQILEQMVEEKLLTIEALEQGYANNADVLKILNNVKEEIIVRQYIKDEVSKLTVSDAEISTHYNANKENFVSPEAVRASHILVSSEAEAQDIIAQLNKGGDFAKLAKEKSSDGSAPNGGDLDFFTRGQMVKSFEDVAFSLKTGEITKTPLQTQFGWHVVKTTDRRAAKQKELNEVKQDIRNELLLQKQKARVDTLLETAKTKYPVQTDLTKLK